MSHSLLNPSDSDRKVLIVIEDQLHSEGVAGHVTVRGLLRTWSWLADQAADYGDSVDDYTNDLTTRDILERALVMAPEPLRALLSVEIEAADRRFRDSTVPDELGKLGQYFQVDRREGWWWRRVPRTGSLASHLGCPE